MLVRAFADALWLNSPSAMDKARIAELLRPFLTWPLSERQLGDISTYIDILLRWNQRINLTAVRQPEEIVTRHFGESLFAAQHLFPANGHARMAGRGVDVGSGAGFPGLPIKIWAPEIGLTLIESNHKKATFLKEVVRTLGLEGVEVFTGRAETFPTASADVVTLRAVERFDSVLPTATGLVKPRGRLALLIGISQVEQARAIATQVEWQSSIPVPQANYRVLLSGGRR
jgi:16S rRNA (guanine527-N7)-methyltransferase